MRPLELVSNAASVSFEIDIAPNLGLVGQWIQEMVGVVSEDLQVVVVVVVVWGHQVVVVVVLLSLVEGEED